MAKAQTRFVCRQCGYESPKWLGKCPSCDEWGTLEETVTAATPKSLGARAPLPTSFVGRSKPQRLSDVPSPSEEGRILSGMGEFDRVLGGGIVRGALTLIGGDPGVGKCLAGSERVLDPATGAYLPLLEWAERLRPILALNETTHRLRPASVSMFHAQGVREIVEVTTRLGRTLRCTPSHPVLTPVGWMPVGGLMPGTRVASPRALPFFGSQSMDDTIVERIACGLLDASGQHHAVPQVIFGLPRSQVAYFLGVLFSSNGQISPADFGISAASYSTHSRRLAQDVQHLLLRFGVITKLQIKESSRNRLSHVAYELLAMGLQDAQHLLKESGIKDRAEVEIIHGRASAPCQCPVSEDIYWDEISCIVPAGTEAVFDISVPEGANFVANDLIVHNSTLLTQIAGQIAMQGGKTLYVSGEESATQIKLRAERLGITGGDLLLHNETDVTLIAATIQAERPLFVIIDSIQTMHHPEIESPAGSVSQVRAATQQLAQVAKGEGIPIFLVGHVTKDGALAGPRVLEHMVDTVLTFEGDRHYTYRILRAVKNRFGSTDELGLFEMHEEGLVEVPNPSEMLLAERTHNSAGSAVLATVEGTRPLLIEVQALVAPSYLSNPRRTVSGVDVNRVNLILAVLEKRVGISLANQDVFVNLAGGVRVEEPAADLAVAVAAASNFQERPVDSTTIFAGEVGLGGEVRAVGHMDLRLREAARMGFRQAIICARNAAGLRRTPDIKVIGVDTVRQALEAALTRP